MSEADDATCMTGSVIVNGKEIRVSVDTIGVMHIRREVRNEELRLDLVRRSSRVDRDRELKSMRQCLACSVLYIELIDEKGQELLMEFRPPGGQLLNVVKDEPV